MKQEQTPHIDEAAMVGTANDIIKGRPTEIEIGGKRWKLRRISNAQAAKIGEYAQEARQIQAEQKLAREKQSQDQDNAQEPQKDSVREKLERFTQEAKEGRTEPLQSEQKQEQEQEKKVVRKKGRHI